ncbi:MAG TPA: hypothetical protein VGZ52_07850 [Acidimicrobiales bacterium]|jgi:hypothetical protein|nr:hypothetical protein [Acidimicrobiales bacterium]
MRDITTRGLLLVIAIGNGVVGLWASVAPRSFYDDFPGAGRHWVAVDGPYNEHLVRDVGALNLALMAVLVAAIVRGGRYLVQVVAAAELIYSLPHFLYHATHLDPFEGGDKVALLVSLGITIIVPIALLVRSSRDPAETITTVASRPH